MQQLLQRIEKRVIARPKAVAIRTPKCYHFGRSSFKTVRFWRTDCHGAAPLAMTVLFENGVL